MPEPELDLKIWRAELEEDRIRLIRDMLESYRQKYAGGPNILFVKRGMFKNLPRAAMLFGMPVIQVENMAECRDSPYVSGEMIVAFARIDKADLSDKAVSWPPFITHEELMKRREELGKATFEREFKGDPR